MNDVIRLLPDSVANQIAAGEVIQRPANVVKELVENSIDAGATKIDVYVIDAGRTSIQVVDDGEGMSETDARLAFERHATSKIQKAEDLYALSTMGFRGEALPSIAAVAMVDMHTRRKEDELGTRLCIAGSRVESQELCACAVGCSVEVKNIFFNVPARRKFLKSNTTEMNNIVSAFERIALVYPEVEFSLKSNGGELMKLSRGNVGQRIAEVFGKRVSQSLLKIDATTSICRVSGYVGKPESAKKKCSMQYFFVNGRYMRHAYFAKAVATAYERLVPVGEQVPYFIYFDVDPTTIDVNIHPAKTEVKFENEQAVWQILSAAVREAVGVFSEIPRLNFDAEPMVDIPVFSKAYDKAPYVDRGVRERANDIPWETLYPEKNMEKKKGLFEEATAGDAEEFPITTQTSVFYQYKGQYVVTAVTTGLMLVDQHKAHTRVLYDRYLRQLKDDSPISQRLLFPEAVKFSEHETNMVASVINQMEKMGFELSPLGADNYAINSVPDGVAGLNPSKLLSDMMEDALEAGTTVVEDIRHCLALSLARKAAIPVGQVLTDDEMAQLVRDLMKSENSGTTPDGKKTYIIVSDAEILRYFT